jgi:hypothetical protein
MVFIIIPFIKFKEPIFLWHDISSEEIPILIFDTQYIVVVNIHIAYITVYTLTLYFQSQ